MCTERPTNKSKLTNDRKMRFLTILSLVAAEESLWERESRIDRANLIVTGDQTTVGYWLWQNSVECDHCRRGFIYTQ